MVVLVSMDHTGLLAAILKVGILCAIMANRTDRIPLLSRQSSVRHVAT